MVLGLTAGRARPELWALGAILLAGALWRLLTLDHQSLWYDEALTWQLVVQPLGDTVQGVADTENTPPLFYVLTHFTTELIGADEVGMRVVSALAGAGTIVVAFLCGRELTGRGAAIIAAGLVAVNPFLFWFSQEARSYALLVFLTAVALFCFLRVIAEPRNGWALAGWVVSSAAAVATHYFAIFPMAAEAIWILVLLARSRLWGRLALAMLAAAAAVAAIAPMAIDQEASGRAGNILYVSLSTRVAQVPKHFFVGYFGPHQPLLAVLSALLLIVAAVGLWRIRRQRAVVATLTVAAATIVIPMALAVVGVDFVNSRNALAGLVPVLVLAGAGFASLPAHAGITGASALAVLGLVTTIAVDVEPSYQRANWRGIAAAMGDSPDRRLLVVSPFNGEVALRPYRDDLTQAVLPRRLREVMVAGVGIDAESGDRTVPPRPEPKPLPGFKLVERDLDSSYTLYRYRAPRPTVVRPLRVLGTALGTSSVLFVAPD